MEGCCQSYDSKDLLCGLWNQAPWQTTFPSLLCADNILRCGTWNSILFATTATDHIMGVGQAWGAQNVDGGVGVGNLFPNMRPQECHPNFLGSKRYELLQCMYWAMSLVQHAAYTVYYWSFTARAGYYGFCITVPERISHSESPPPAPLPLMFRWRWFYQFSYVFSISLKF